MLIEILLLTAALGFLWHWLEQWRLPKNIPPGPIMYPVVGSLIRMGLIGRGGAKTPYEIFQELSRQYGPVLFMKVGVLYQVVLEDYQIIKDLLSSDIWVDRFYDEWLAQRAFGKTLGVLVIGGNVWKEMRRFSVRTLRDFGFGKQKSMESTIQDELDDLTRTLTEEVRAGGGKSVVAMKQYFTISVLNILWSMMAGVRFSHDDKTLHRLLFLMDQVVRANAIGSIGTTLYTAFPFLRHILPKITKHGQQRLELFREMHKFFRDILEERRAEGHYREEQRDFIDVFLREIDEHRNEDSESNLYTDEQFIVVSMDLFMAGSETTSNTMEFALLYMILNPEIQRRVQAEIDAVVGSSRFPSVLDKPKMPYTEATLLEVQRLASVVPIIIRSPTQETSIGEYTIPKGTLGVINIYGVHMSEKVWESPEVFRPERFLDADNNVINAQKIIPFGIGRRVCIGEVLARTSLFTFFTAFLQRFSFEASPTHPLPTMKPALGFTLSPKPYHALVKARVPSN